MLSLELAKCLRSFLVFFQFLEALSLIWKAHRLPLLCRLRVSIFDKRASLALESSWGLNFNLVNSSFSATCLFANWFSWFLDEAFLCFQDSISR